jgi:DNA-binding Lrp family transcriptional regulator
MPSVYRNEHARLLYLHMALRAGYHDNDRDSCRLSVRRLAAEVGLTLSATRHALKVLENAVLIKRYQGAFAVRKFAMSAPVTPRPRSEKKRREQEAKAIEDAMRAEREQREADERRRLKEEEAATGKTAYQRHVEDLERRAAAGDEDARRALAYHKKLKK